MTPEVLLQRTQDPHWFRCCYGQIQCLIFFKKKISVLSSWFRRGFSRYCLPCSCRQRSV